METYIRRYDNVITSEVCDRLIKRFEDNPDQYEKHKQGEMSFTQINLLKHQDWAEDTNIIATALMEQVEKYKESCKIIGNMWPEKFTLEPLRMKRYLPDGTDQIGNHVDVNNYESARRFLVFFLYLDTNSKGSTTFPQHDITSVCEKGSVLIFPPMWPWLHAGEKPVDKPKYIIGSYLHYV